MVHTYAWIAWLIAALVSLSATRNPLYLILILFCIGLVYLNLDREGERVPTPVSPLRFMLIVISLTALFNMLTSHFGETILITIPGEVPLVSGPITLEALVFGAINGLVLSGFFASFLVLNRAMPVRALLRLVPRAFYPAAVVISVAVTYIPSTQRQFSQIREAQAIRGYRLRGPRGWLPLLMPLLVGGLERALTLAEAMTARGFASPPQETKGNHQRILLLMGLLLLPAGWIMGLVEGIPAVLPPLVLLVGAGLFVYGLWTAGQRTPRTTYHQERWNLRGWIIVLGTLVVLGAYLNPISGRAGLNYSPYPLLTFPPFDPLTGVMTLGLSAPAAILQKDGSR
jgi:energy-coupling factor transport system permease protein